MPLPRIYQPVALTDSSEIYLDDGGIQHVKALRLREKDALILFNGEGKEYEGKITALNHRSTCVTLFSEQTPATEPRLKIHLLQAIARGERMDYIVQKATELGVTSISPLMTERCEVRLCAERLQKRQKHWQQIVISACEQARRVCIPKIHFPQSLTDSLNLNYTQAVALTLDPEGEQTLGDLDAVSLQTAPEIFILVGPEGGLTASEIQQAKGKGFKPLRLGPRILRTETAAPALLAALQAKWGDFL